MTAPVYGGLATLYLKFRVLLVRLNLRVRSLLGMWVDGVCEGQRATLLISLPRSHDRRRRLFSRLEPSQWNLSLVKACHPPISDSMNDHEWKLFHQMAGHLTAGERGCFLSHRRAWLSAVNSTAKLTIILEDDAVPLYRTLPQFPDLPEDLDVLYLHHFAQLIPSARQLLLSLAGTILSPFGNLLEVHPISAVVASHCGSMNRAAMPASAYAVTKGGGRNCFPYLMKLECSISGIRSCFEVLCLLLHSRTCCHTWRMRNGPFMWVSVRKTHRGKYRPFVSMRMPFILP